MRLVRALLLVLAAATAARADAGQEAAPQGAPPAQDYMLYCMGCHLREGTGLGDRVPPLRGVDRFLDVPEGRTYLVRVPGVANAGLSDQRLAALLNWVLGEFGAGPFEPYTEEEVAPLRKNPFLNASAAREELLRRLAGSAR